VSLIAGPARRGHARSLASSHANSHPKLISRGPRHQDIEKTLNASGAIRDALARFETKQA